MWLVIYNRTERNCSLVYDPAEPISTFGSKFKKRLLFDMLKNDKRSPETCTVELRLYHQPVGEKEFIKAAFAEIRPQQVRKNGR